MQNILIYTPTITPRHTFAFGLFFRDILDIGFELTNDDYKFKESALPKFSYGKKSLSDELFFECNGLLDESEIKPQAIEVFEFEGNKVFFKVSNFASALPFDIFSASFYLASRYEEYLPYGTDEHGRFKHIDSIAFKNDFLKKPLINIWALSLKSLLIKHFPQLSFPNKKFSYISTFDIDTAYAFKERNLSRTLGGYAKALSKFDFKDIIDRSLVLFNLKQDPYDTFDLQERLCKQYKLHQIYFYLVGDYSPHDKNIRLQKSKKLQKLLKHTQSFADIGVHPSYASNRYPAKVKTEMERIEKITDNVITKSRQHFLNMNMPYTYENLIQQGITEDYTMGYATSIGFRANICTPFYFYDLKKEQKTELKLFPFQVMDGTLKDYLKLNSDEASKAIAGIISEIKAVNGLFISLWHNHSLSEYCEWKGWRKVYEQMLQIL
jgi:hypothetical protein